MSSNKLIIAATALALITGCVKKRPPIEGQGENIGDLITMASVNGKTCEIKTGDVRQKLNSSAAQKTDLSAPKYGIKVWDLVRFTSNCPALGDDEIELMGPPHSTINAQWVVDANFLVLYKMVPESELSHLEKPYSFKVGSVWMVPIAGYEIDGFFNVEWVKSPDNRDTNVKKKVGVDAKNFRSANYLSVKKTKLNRFKWLAKTDVFPKQYFRGQWYYAKTVVNTRFQSGQVGALDNSDANFSPASKIEFEMEKTFLVGVNLNVDERLRSKEHNLNLDTAVRIPMRNVDTRAVIVGGGKGIEEEEIQTNTIDEARYLAFDFANTQTLESVDGSNLLGSLYTMFRRRLNDMVIFKDIVIRDDYFSYTVEDRGSEQEIRYSFLRVSPDRPRFQPRHAFREDMLKFGFFKSWKDQIVDEQLRTQNDVEKITFINHFNPQEEIVYRFSTATPKDQWVRDIGREAIYLWQQAFQKAGITTKIRLEEGEGADQMLGDIRYNLINLNDSKAEGLIGYGPSLADSQTGEILSATANLYITNQRDSVAGSLRRYIFEQIGQRFDFTDPNDIEPALIKLKNINLAMQTAMYDASTKERIKNPKMFQWGADYSMSKTPMALVSNEDVKLMTDGRMETFEELYPQLYAKDRTWSGDVLGAGTRAFVTDEVATAAFVNTAPECEGVRQLIKKYKGFQQVPPTQEVVEATRPCSIPLTQFAALSALVHEMGHNLGLRHNFMASRDSKNFIQPGEYQSRYIKVPKEIAKAQSSSIMDYFEGDDGFQVYPGPYDMAALRFSYMGQVENKNHEIVKVDTEKTLTQNLGDSLRRFDFCTDEHLMGMDAFCAQFDRGSSSAEMARLTMNELYRTLAGTYRYQAAQSLWNPAPQLMGTLAVSSVRLKSHYDRWRVLLAEVLGDRKRYMQGMSVEEYQKVISQLMNSPRKAEVEDLLKARNTMVLGLIDLAFMPNRYCVVENSDKHTLLLEISRIRKEMQRMGQVGRITSCRDFGVSEYLTSMGLTLKAESGFDVDPGSYELDAIRQDLDFVGVGPMRAAAMSLLTTRETALQVNALQGFGPSMMDEPDIRQVVMTILQSRIANGAFINPNKIELEEPADARLLGMEDVKARIGAADGKGPQRFLNFDAESNHVMGYMALAAQSMIVPDDFKESASRLGPYQTMVINNPELYKKQIKNIVQVDSSTYVITTAGSDESFSSQLIDHLGQIEQMQQMAQLPLMETQKAVESILKGFIEANAVLPAEKPTVLSVMNYGLTVQAMQQAWSNGNQQLLAQIMGMMATPDQEPIQAIFQGVAQAAQANNMTEEALMTLMQKFAKGGMPTDAELPMYNLMMSPVDAKNFPGGLPDAKGLRERGDQIITMIQASQQREGESGLELDSQKNLIIKILMGLAN